MIGFFDPFSNGGGIIDTTIYGTKVSVSMNSINNDYVITVSLINEDDSVLNSQSIDLPIETLVKSGRYDSETKTIILVLEDDTEIEIPIGDLVSDLQTKITNSNKLNSDLVDDTNSINKFVSNTEKTNWNNHIANTNNPHNVTKAQIGLDNVDNTSDINKPISTATQTALDNKVDKETGKGLSTNDYTTTEKTKLAGIAEGAEVNVQSDWNQTDNSQDDYIKNKPNLSAVATSGSYNDLSDKPTIPAAQVNADWNASSGVSEILNKPTLGTAAAADTTDFATAAQGTKADTAVQPADLAPVATSGSYNDLSNKPTIPEAQVNADWNSSSGISEILNKPNLAAVATSGSYNDLSDKPTIPAAQIQSDWNQTNNQALDYIKNKPTIPTAAAEISYDNTTTPVPSTNVQDAIDNIYDLILPILTINITALSSISITDGTTTITGTANVGGKFKTQIPNFGTWTITATLNGDTATEEIVINQIKTYEVNMRYVQVYGVSWGFSGKVLSRTDKAALFTDPVPYVNDGVMTAAGCSSPFDELGPWSGMEVSVDTLGNSLVSIPKFWYKINKTASALTIQIADGPIAGFNVSPAHRARNAQDNDKDVVYIGRYHCDADYKSKSGVIPKASITRAAARTGVHALGNEYWQLDMSMWITIWMLYIVEFANWNSQAMIGYNCGNNSSKENTGSTDAMPYHTGTMQTTKTTYGVGVQYRYIEDPWGNVLDWCDGITFNQGDIYCFDNFTDYSDSYTSTGAKLVGTRPTTGNWIKNWGLSSEAGYEWFMYPSEVQGAQTEIPDYCYYGTSGVVLYVGGGYSQSAYLGLFFLVGSDGASYSYGNVGVRLQRRPSN